MIKNLTPSQSLLHQVICSHVILKGEKYERACHVAIPSSSGHLFPREKDYDTNVFSTTSQSLLHQVICSHIEQRLL